jgi:hypothetical protein
MLRLSSIACAAVILVASLVVASSPTSARGGGHHHGECGEYDGGHECRHAEHEHGRGGGHHHLFEEHHRFEHQGGSDGRGLPPPAARDGAQQPPK